MDGPHEQSEAVWMDLMNNPNSGGTAIPNSRGTAIPNSGAARIPTGRNPLTYYLYIYTRESELLSRTEVRGTI